jgi:DNA (cytosine-5)-methyltransferase 1
MDMPRVLDLFCGAGGLSHGFSTAGFKVVAGLDWDKDAITTFSANHNESQGICADIDAVEPGKLAERLSIIKGELDCLIGGPPCQGFSRNRAFRYQNGVFVDDPRNELYKHFFAFVEHFMPRVVVIENVPEILTKKENAYKTAILSMFEALNYHVEFKVLNAAEFGVPQWRRRAFFIAGRENQKVSFPMSTTLPGPRAGRRTPSSVEKIHPKRSAKNQLTLDMLTLHEGPTVWEAIGDLHGSYSNSLNGRSDYAREAFSDYQSMLRQNQATVMNHFPWPLSHRQLQRIRLLREGQSQLHLPPELQTKQGYGSAYRRMQSDAQALTITTWMFHPGSGMFTHPFDDRVITIREAARIQSFSDDYVFKGGYHAQCRQIGNAVPPLLGHCIAKAIIDVLR